MSTRVRIVLAVLMVSAAVVASVVRVSIPSRPVRDIEEIASLRDRGVNVVFILVDMLRADRLSTYGYARHTSPNLDDLVSVGVRFAHVESQSSWTKCSMASLWTGVFPPRTGVVRFNHALPESVRMPAEIFREAGYATAGIWRNGWVAPNFGFSQGFDLYIKPVPRAEDPQNIRRETPGTRKLPGTDADVTQAALEFLATHPKDQKFLLYLHYMDVHQYTYDTEAAEQGFGSSLSDAYDASIHWVDRNVGTVVQELEERGLLKNTIVVLAADHGEAFREHHVEGHARNLYREVTEVPLLMLLPFRLKNGLVVEPLVRNVDIWPTILDLAGLSPLAGTDGVSLVPLMLAAARGEVPKSPPSVSYLDQTWGRTDHDPEPLIAMRDGDRRVIFQTKAPEKTLQVFDHASDPGEQRNLAKQAPEWAAPMRSELEQELLRTAPWGQADKVEISEMYLQQLRALGYVGK